MTYFGMPFGMWALFAPSFRKQLTAVLGYDADTAKAITKKAKQQYRQIIAGLPEFEKADRFKMNLVNCAMLGAFVLSMPQRPEVDRLTDYYARAMMTAPMQWFCRKSGKSKFTAKDIAAMKATAALKAADLNPYSWNMEFYEYPDGSGYEGRFTKCGICVLMKELGLYDLTPALCHLDYTMSEAGGVTNFVRQYTLASGGPYCDCGYKKKGGRTMKAKETYLSRDFRETVAQRFPAQAKQLNAAFDMRLSALLAENAGASKEKQYHLKRQILPGIAAYETLQRVMPKEEALQTVHGYVERLARTSHKQLAALLHIPGLYRLVPGVFVKSTRSVFGPAAGFAPKELQTGNGVWRVDMMKCPYHDTCAEYGCPELCRCFCDSDDISYTSLHPKLIWERSMTLGRGNDRCDFCMKVR